FYLQKRKNIKVLSCCFCHSFVRICYSFNFIKKLVYSFHLFFFSFSNILLFLLLPKIPQKRFDVLFSYGILAVNSKIGKCYLSVQTIFNQHFSTIVARFFFSQIVVKRDKIR